MKKNSFIEGAVIATLGIVFVKLIGILYVIPFYSIIGERGGALYGYGYNIYQLFLGISSAGFPFAISKITSEYSALGYNKAVKDTYKVATKIILLISLVIFGLLFFFAPQIGRFIIGSATNGNTYNDITFVIRMVSFSILIVPFLSVSRGFLQGYKFITPGTNSQIIEQLVRVGVILFGSFLVLRTFHLGLTMAVGISVFASFIGGVVSYAYLKRKIVKSKLLLKEISIDEKVITKKEIVKKILSYSVPFILISLAYNLYNTVDMILVLRTLGDILKYDGAKIESIMSVYTTWGSKLNMIILAVSTGIVTSLIPNIVSSFAKKNMIDVNRKVNKAMQCTLMLVVPLTLFLSVLAKPVWTLFYGSSYYGPVVYKVFVYTALFGSFYSVITNVLQGLSKYKLVITSVFVGLLTNALLDVPLMLLANKLGTEPYYGASVATAIGYTLSIYMALHVLKKKYDFDFTSTRKKIFSFVYSWILFVGLIELLKLFVPINLSGRFIQLPILAIYGVVSFGIYVLINYINGNIYEVFNFKFGKKLPKE